MYSFKHLKEVEMSYCEHFNRSFEFSIKFFVSSIKACVHAIYPDVFTTSTTDSIKELSKVL